MNVGLTDEFGWPLSTIGSLRQQQGIRDTLGEYGYMPASGVRHGVAEIVAAEIAEWPQTEDERLRRVAAIEADMATWGDTLDQMKREHDEGRVGDVPVIQ